MLNKPKYNVYLIHIIFYINNKLNIIYKFININSIEN